VEAVLESADACRLGRLGTIRPRIHDGLVGPNSEMVSGLCAFELQR